MDQWLEDFEQTVESAADRLSQISEAKSEEPCRPGGWSPKQIIGHLIDSAANNHARFVLAQLKDDLVFPGYVQDSWVEVQQYQQARWASLVQLWKAYNLHLRHLMSCVPESKRRHQCLPHSLDKIAWHTISPAEATTLEYLMTDYIGHLKHHLAQIFNAVS